MAFENEMNVCELTVPPLAALSSGTPSFGLDDHQLLVARSLDHVEDEVVVADAVDDDRIQVGELLDVLGPRLVVAGVDLAGQDRAHLDVGAADHVLRPRVVGMQRHADAAAAGVGVAGSAAAAAGDADAQQRHADRATASMSSLLFHLLERALDADLLPAFERRDR